MGILWSSIAKERNRKPAFIDELRELLEDFREDFAHKSQDSKSRLVHQLDRLQTLLESQQETLLLFEGILYNIQHRLDSHAISSVGSVTDNDPELTTLEQFSLQNR